jgi:hypothetical protein
MDKPWVNVQLMVPGKTALFAQVWCSGLGDFLRCGYSKEEPARTA